MIISNDRKQIGERLLEFAVQLNGGKKIGAKQILSSKLNISQPALSGYFSGEHIPGNQMQAKLRGLGADTHYIITGEKLSLVQEAGVEYWNDKGKDSIYSIVKQLELRRDLARIINSSIEVLLADLKMKKKIINHPDILTRLLVNHNTYNQDYEILDETEAVYVTQKIDEIVKFFK